MVVNESDFNNGDLEKSIFAIMDSNEKMNLFSDNARLYSKNNSSLLIEQKLKEIMSNAR